MRLSLVEALHVYGMCQGKEAQNQFAMKVNLRDLKSFWSLEKNDEEWMLRQVTPEGFILWIELDDQLIVDQYIKS